MENIYYYILGFFINTPINQRIFNLNDFSYNNINIIDSEFNTLKFMNFNEIINLLKNSNEFNSFCRGFIDKNGILIYNNNKWTLTVQNNVSIFVDYVQKLKINYTINNDKIIFLGTNTFDLLSYLYGGNCQIYYLKKFPLPIEIITQVIGINTKSIPKHNFVLEKSGSIMPSKKRPSDIGYDLTIINIYKVYNSGVIVYDTGIIVQPDNGWYCEIVPRSSFR